jgi:hypothetical protein
VAQPSGVNEPSQKLVGIVNRSSCGAAAKTIFHEVHHQNQPGHVRETVFMMEVDAYTEAERWAITRGIPEELNDINSSLRTRDKKGAEIPSAKAIEAKVTAQYGGPTPAPGAAAEGGQAEDEGQVVGHEAPNKTRVRMPGKDSPETRDSIEGDTYLEKPPAITGAVSLDPKVWQCPGEKEEK